MLCRKCYGSGRVMGNGMIYQDCDCETYIHKPVIDRRSKVYRESIDNIMKASDISRDEAVKIFDSEFEKIT